jgi:four helix bundle protein
MRAMKTGTISKIYFDHEKLDVYRGALEFVAWADKLLQGIEVGISAKDHLKRASESAVRNLVRANSKRRQSERTRVFEIAYGSALECVACLDVLRAWGLVGESDLIGGKEALHRVVSMIIRIRAAQSPTVHECRGHYVGNGGRPSEPSFSHDKLRVYRSALEFISWSAALIQSEAIGLSCARELDKHATGIVLNIAEGNGKFSEKDRRRFLQIALSAGLQAATSLDILEARSVISRRQNERGKLQLRELVSMIGALARGLS